MLQLEVATRSIPSSAIGLLCPFAGDFFISTRDEKRRVEMSADQMSLRTTMKKLNGDSLTPILIFRKMQGKRKFLLESSSKHDGSGRYSFIGMDPLKSYSGRDGKIEEHVYATGK